MDCHRVVPTSRTAKQLARAPAFQAVAYLVNRTALTRLGGLDAWTPNEQLLPPGIRGYRDANTHPLDKPDLAKAKEPLGGKTGEVVMYTSSDEQGRNTGQLVQANLEAIGLDVEVKPYTFAVLIDKTGTRGDRSTCPVQREHARVQLRQGGCATYSDAWSGLNLAMLCPKR